MQYVVNRSPEEVQAFMSRDGNQQDFQISPETVTTTTPSPTTLSAAPYLTKECRCTEANQCGLKSVEFSLGMSCTEGLVSDFFFQNYFTNKKHQFFFSRLNVVDMWRLTWTLQSHLRRQLFRVSNQYKVFHFSDITHHIWLHQGTSTTTSSTPPPTTTLDPVTTSAVPVPTTTTTSEKNLDNHRASGAIPKQKDTQKPFFRYSLPSGTYLMLTKVTF